jgi:hypothetical protein
MFKRTLACSFCGKTAAQVAKLVAGPRVYICDVCASEVVRIMNDPDAGSRSAVGPAKFSLWARLIERLRGGTSLFRWRAAQESLEEIVNGWWLRLARAFGRPLNFTVRRP